MSFIRENLETPFGKREKLKNKKQSVQLAESICVFSVYAFFAAVDQTIKNTEKMCVLYSDHFVLVQKAANIVKLMRSAVQLDESFCTKVGTFTTFAWLTSKLPIHTYSVACRLVFFSDKLKQKKNKKKESIECTQPTERFGHLSFD